MVQLGPQYDLAKRIAQLEQLVAQLAANQLGQAFSATQSDGSLGMAMLQSTQGAGATQTVWYQGPNSPRDPNTGQHPLLVYIGQTVVGGVFSDNAVIFLYPSGVESMTVGAGGVGVLDTRGNVVFTTDAPSGQGLGRPWIPIQAPVVADASKWPSTTATSWGEIARSYVNEQHPKIQWAADGYCPTGTGQVQMLVRDFSNNVMASGPVHTVSSGFGAWTDVLTLPDGFDLQDHYISVMAQMTSGTGSIASQTWELYGRQS